LIEKFLKDPVTIDLQQRLIARQKQTASWLYDWWNDWAYMSYRDPVSFNVNYFYAFVDDPIRKLPALRAASIVKQALNFRDLIISQTLTPDTARSGPLCSHQYRFMFNSCRIPAIPSDTTRSSDLSNNFLIAIRKNQFFKIDLDYNGSPLSLADLVIQFEKIYKSAHLASPVGALTTDNRNVWTEARNLLLQSPTNKFCLDQIEKSVFVVCLDDTSPVTKNEISRACWHGNGANRFFDKSLQFIIFDNGRAGFNGEHSLMDATPTSRLCEFICKE
jgi:carnitine O-acetyltransferase